MVIKFEGKTVVIRKIIDRLGRVRYYKSVRGKAFKPIKRKKAIYSISSIKAYKTRRKRVKEVERLERMEEELEEKVGELRWFVGRTSQPAPNGYIIVVGGFTGDWTEEEMYDHVQRTLGMSFVEHAILDYIPANYTYIYDLDGRNVTMSIIRG